MKALGHYLIYRLANAQILQLALVQERKRYLSRNNKFYLIRGQSEKCKSIDKRTTKRNEKTLQRKMEGKSRSTTKSFLSVDTADITESSSTSESTQDSDSDFENSIPRKFKQLAPISKPMLNLYQTLLPPVIELVYLAEQQQ